MESESNAVENVEGSFQNLIVWQRAMELARAIYKLTSAFPATERFGLTDQMRRASVSVASNIAEGYGRSSKGEYVVFLGHARGSNCELLTQLLLAKDLDMGHAQDVRAAIGLSGQVARMLLTMIRKLRMPR